MKKQGLFITFEGPDGSGKTSCIKAVIEWLNQLINENKIRYNSVFLTREPGGTENPLGEKIRTLLLDTENLQIHPRAEALLFSASRASHVELAIKPHLNNNEIVISDRFTDSSMVYQGGSRNLGYNNIKMINEFATDYLEPDVTFLLMVSAEIGLERIQKNSRETNRLDKESLDFHKKTQQFYQELLTQDTKNRIVLIDANQDLEHVISDTKNKLLEIIKKYE